MTISDSAFELPAEHHVCRASGGCKTHIRYRALRHALCGFTPTTVRPSGRQMKTRAGWFNDAKGSIPCKPCEAEIGLISGENPSVFDDLNYTYTQERES